MAWWKKVIALAAGAGLLAGTHWLAYREGRREEKAGFKGMILDTQAAGHEDQLRASVAILRVATRHPSEFTQNELFALRTRAEMQATDVEKLSVPHAQRVGNLDDEKRLTALLAAARELLAKLPAR